jgi:flagellar hook protein FlgE
MSIYGAMFSGVSGLNAQSGALGMIADNISNVNTIGYKSSRAMFSTLVTQAATQNHYTPGGVQVRPMQDLQRQGLLQSSVSNTDIALSGNGFFVVGSKADATHADEFLFTRAGAFQPNVNGNLVNTAGYFLQGWPVDSNGTPIGNTSVLSSVETVNIGSLTGTARATTGVTMNLNLPSASSVGDTFQATAQIFDSLGNAHDLTLAFTKTADNNWDYAVTDPTLSETGATSGTVTGGAAGSVSFNGDGTPAAFVLPAVDVTWTIGGASPSTVAVDLGTVGASDGITQFAGDFSVFIDQDGVKFGQFSDVSIDENGLVIALFNNGERRPIYQLPVAQFANPDGLEARGGNAYIQSDRSGDLTLNAANTSGAGRVAASALEASTVDLADEFTNMIVTQRAYSASSKVINTADEMLEELLRIGN